MILNNIKWIKVLNFIFILFLISVLLSWGIDMTTDDISSDFANVLVIPIYGIISVQSSDSLFDTGFVSSNEIVKIIDDAKNNNYIDAVVFEINSPGGAPVASQEIMSKIKSFNKTNVAFVKEMCASGAYWIATGSDYIIANDLSMVGSIGVISSYLDYSGLLSRYNITYERLVAGDLKDMGSPLKKMTDEERQIWQNNLDILHDYFIDSVSENRNLSYNYTKTFSDGRVYLGVESKKLGLIDETGSIDDVYSYIKNKTGKSRLIVNRYEKESSLKDLLLLKSNSFAYFFGKGFSANLIESNSELFKKSDSMDLIN
jgi:protease-4